MELKVKYQYTYFIYPYLIEEKKHSNYLYKLLKNKRCKLKWFDNKKDVEIDKYFLPEIKNKIFWSLDMKKESIKQYESMDTKMKSRILSKKDCNVFQYDLQDDIQGKIGEKDGIFFDILKAEIICFSTGVCFLLLKTTLNQSTNFSEVLNFNYKFRDINSKSEHSKEYETIKIQTEKLNNMQNFSHFISEIAGPNLLAKQINVDTNKLITYSYVCLDQSSWNENTDTKLIEKEFEKYRNVKSAGEQIEDVSMKEENVYTEKYKYYGFSNDSTVLFTCNNNIKNYTTLPFQYENEQLYHYILNLYKKIYLKKLNYDFRKTNKFEQVKEKFLNFAKKDWIYEITDDEIGRNLEEYYIKKQNVQNTFLKLKQEYDLLYKDYEISKNKKYNKWLSYIIIAIITVNIIYLFLK